MGRGWPICAIRPAQPVRLSWVGKEPLLAAGPTIRHFGSLQHLPCASGEFFRQRFAWIGTLVGNHRPLQTGKDWEEPMRYRFSSGMLFALMFGLLCFSGTSA